MTQCHTSEDSKLKTQCHMTEDSNPETECHIPGDSNPMKQSHIPEDPHSMTQCLIPEYWSLMTKCHIAEDLNFKTRCTIPEESSSEDCAINLKPWLTRAVLLRCDPCDLFSNVDISESQSGHQIPKTIFFANFRIPYGQVFGHELL
jgi:hypothetical protein